MQQQPVILVVESDILIRHMLCEYLRECGYKVVEAVNADEARQFLGEVGPRISLMLVDISEGAGFDLARWTRENHPVIKVLLVGTIEAAAEKAGELCAGGPPVTKPYDHRLVADRIRRLLAGREKAAGKN